MAANFEHISMKQKYNLVVETAMERPLQWQKKIVRLFQVLVLTSYKTYRNWWYTNLKKH